MSWEKIGDDIASGPLGLIKWVVITTLVVVIIGGVTRLIVLPSSMALERTVIKNSFQYKEGMEQRAAILEANLVEIDILISQHPEQRQTLSQQKRVITAQLRAVTINN